MMNAGLHIDSILDPCIMAFGVAKSWTDFLNAVPYTIRKVALQ